MFVCLSIVGCSCSEGFGTGPTPFFPVERDHGSFSVYMQARAEGRLILKEGCLRLKRLFGESQLIIWPHGYELRIEEKTIQVIDADGRMVARVGDWIEVGGGESKSVEHIEDYIGQSLPPDCAGPYWIAGPIEK